MKDGKRAIAAALVLVALHEVLALALSFVGIADRMLAPSAGALVSVLAVLAFVLLRLAALFAAPGLALAGAISIVHALWSQRRGAQKGNV
jgi:hypothetical protein